MLRPLTFRLGLAAAAVALGACGTARPAEAPRDLVVLVHGMGRTPISMAPLAVSLRRAGYRVLNVGSTASGRAWPRSVRCSTPR